MQVDYLNLGASGFTFPDDRCRLNAATHLMQDFDTSDPDKMALLARIGPLTMAAVENIPALAATEE